MALTFNILTPDQGASYELVPRIKEISFGDGYVMSEADGLNSMSEVWALTWTGYTTAEVNQLDSFFRQHGGYMWFYWTPPNQAQAKKFLCKRWSPTYRGPRDCDMTATFTQTFKV